MNMTQSQVRFRNEVNDLAYKAVLELQQKKLKNRKKGFDLGILKKAKIPFIAGAICIAAYNLIPFSKFSENTIYKEDFQSTVGKEIAVISSGKTTKNGKVGIMFLFNKNNQRYAPLAEALISELKNKNFTVNADWPLDGEVVDEDEFGDRLDAAISKHKTSDTLVLISAGGVDYIEECGALSDFMESGKKLIVLGNCSIDSSLINLADSPNCVLISRKKGWLKDNAETGISIEKFVSDDYVLIGKI